MIGQRIKERRIELKMSQKELADKANKGVTTISNYETGYSSPDNETLVKLACALNVSTDYLLGHTPKKSNPKVDVIAAHLDSDKLSDDDLDDIQQFIQFVQSRKE